MTQPTKQQVARYVQVRAISSLSGMGAGTILCWIGAWGLWGVWAGLLSLGTLLFVVAVLFGLG